MMSLAFWLTICRVTLAGGCCARINVVLTPGAGASPGTELVRVTTLVSMPRVTTKPVI
jgi:hypothetical protein